MNCPPGQSPVTFNVIVLISTATTMTSTVIVNTSSPRLDVAKSSTLAFLSNFNAASLKSVAYYAAPKYPSFDTAIGSITTCTGTSDISTWLGNVNTYIGTLDNSVNRPLLLMFVDQTDLSPDISQKVADLTANKCRVICVSMNSTYQLSQITGGISLKQQYANYFGKDFTDVNTKGTSVTQIVNYFGSLGPSLQECAAPSTPPPTITPTDPPQSTPITEQPATPTPSTIPPTTDPCSQDNPCGGWQTSGTGGTVTSSQCSGMTISTPPTTTVPPTTVPTPSSSTSSSKACINLIKNGDFENGLTNWTIDVNDGTVNLPTDNLIHSTVLQYKYSGTKSSNCIQIIKNSEFDDLSHWNIVTKDGYVGTTSVVTGSQLVLERHITRKCWNYCEDLHEAPVALAVNKTISYPCNNSVASNCLRIDLSDDIAAASKDPECGGKTSLKIVACTATKGTVSFSGKVVLYSPPVQRLADNEESIITYTVSDGSMETSSTITIHCNPPPPIVAKQVHLKFTCPCNDSPSNLVSVDLTKYVDNPTGDELFFSTSCLQGTAYIDGNNLVYLPPYTALSSNESISFNYTALSADGRTDSSTVTVTCLGLDVATRVFTIYCQTAYSIDLLDNPSLTCGISSACLAQQTDFGTTTIANSQATWTGEPLSDQTSFLYTITSDLGLDTFAKIVLRNSAPTCQTSAAITISRKWIGPNTWTGMTNRWGDLPDTWDGLDPLLVPESSGNVVTNVIDVGSDGPFTVSVSPDTSVATTTPLTWNSAGTWNETGTWDSLVTGSGSIQFYYRTGNTLDNGVTGDWKPLSTQLSGKYVQIKYVATNLNVRSLSITIVPTGSSKQTVIPTLFPEVVGEFVSEVIDLSVSGLFQTTLTPVAYKEVADKTWNDMSENWNSVTDSWNNLVNTWSNSLAGGPGTLQFFMKTGNKSDGTVVGDWKKVSSDIGQYVQIRCISNNIIVDNLTAVFAPVAANQVLDIDTRTFAGRTGIGAFSLNMSNVTDISLLMSDTVPVTWEYFVTDKTHVRFYNEYSIPMECAVSIIVTASDTPVPKEVLTIGTTCIPVHSFLTTSVTHNDPGTGHTVDFSFQVSCIGNICVPSSVSWTVSGNPSDFVNNVVPTGILSFASNVTNAVISFSVNGGSTKEFEVVLSNSVDSTIGISVANGHLV